MEIIKIIFIHIILFQLIIGESFTPLFASETIVLEEENKTEAVEETTTTTDPATTEENAQEGTFCTLNEAEDKTQCEDNQIPCQIGNNQYDQSCLDKLVQDPNSLGDPTLPTIGSLDKGTLELIYDLTRTVLDATMMIVGLAKLTSLRKQSPDSAQQVCWFPISAAYEVVQAGLDLSEVVEYVRFNIAIGKNIDRYKVNRKASGQKATFCYFITMMNQQLTTLKVELARLYIQLALGVVFGAAIMLEQFNPSLQEKMHACQVAELKEGTNPKNPGDKLWLVVDVISVFLNIGIDLTKSILGFFDQNDRAMAFQAARVVSGEADEPNKGKYLGIEVGFQSLTILSVGWTIFTFINQLVRRVKHIGTRTIPYLGTHMQRGIDQLDKYLGHPLTLFIILTVSTVMNGILIKLSTDRLNIYKERFKTLQKSWGPMLFSDEKSSVVITEEENETSSSESSTESTIDEQADTEETDTNEESITLGIDPKPTGKGNLVRRCEEWNKFVQNHIPPTPTEELENSENQENTIEEKDNEEESLPEVQNIPTIKSSSISIKFLLNLINRNNLQSIISLVQAQGISKQSNLAIYDKPCFKKNGLPDYTCKCKESGSCITNPLTPIKSILSHSEEKGTVRFFSSPPVKKILKGYKSFIQGDSITDQPDKNPFANEILKVEKFFGNIWKGLTKKNPNFTKLKKFKESVKKEITIPLMAQRLESKLSKKEIESLLMPNFKSANNLLSTKMKQPDEKRTKYLMEMVENVPPKLKQIIEKKKMSFSNNQNTSTSADLNKEIEDQSFRNKKYKIKTYIKDKNRDIWKIISLRYYNHLKELMP